MAIYTDAAPSLAGSTIMLTILALLTYGLRVYCRVTRKSWGMEDWIMTGALVGSHLEIPEHPTNEIVKGTIRGAGGRMYWRSIQWNRHSQFDIGRGWKCTIRGTGKKGERGLFIIFTEIKLMDPQVFPYF